MEATTEMTDTLERTVKSIQESDTSLSSAHTPAFVAISLSTGPEGGHLDGWFTYIDNGYGKVHIKSGKLIEHTGLFAGVHASALAQLPPPGEFAGKPGTVKASGGLFGGSVSFYDDNNNLIGQFPVTGPGTPSWSFKAHVTYTKG